MTAASKPLNRPKYGQVTPDTTGTFTSDGGQVIAPDQKIKDVNPSGTADPDNPSAAILTPIENDDPLRRRIRNPRRRSWLGKAIQRVFQRWHHELTPEERADLAERDRRKKLQTVLTEEAKTAEKRMINRLTRMNICHVSRKSDGSEKKITAVRFDKILMEPNALWFRVNISRLPHGVIIGQLTDKETVTNLSIAVGHKVSCQWTETSGVWYIVERASGMMGIPNHVQLSELWDKMPASKDPLTIPVGVTQNSTPVYLSLDDMVHMLVAGTTGGGKSNFLNVVLCTLIRRNKPDKLKFLLVDLKGGLEFNYYEGIPHLLHPNIKVTDEKGNERQVAQTGIVNERDDVGPLLSWVIREGERRMGVLLDAGAKNIGEYNSHRKKSAMSQLVVVIDEWADVKLGKGGKETETRLANAVQRMRAVGIHVIVCTQVPQKEVIGTLIKANLPAKFAFSCADLQGSMAILNSAEALNLQPRGRCVVRFQDTRICQTPFIPKNVILDTVKGAITGEYGTVAATHDVTPEEIMAWALQHNNGWLTISTLYAQYKPRGLTRQELLEWLQSWEEKEYLINSTMYVVEPGAGTKGRRLVVAAEKKEEDDGKQEGGKSNG